MLATPEDGKVLNAAKNKDAPEAQLARFYRLLGSRV